MLTMQMITDAKSRIWGSESYRVTIIKDNDKFYAECEDIITTKRLTADNYIRVLNDMFYDFCLEKAMYMGVS